MGWPKGRKNPERSKLMGENNPSKCLEVRAKIRKQATGRKNPEQSLFMKKNNPMKNSTTADKVSKTKKGRKQPWVSEYNRTRVNPLLGKKRPDITGDKSPFRTPKHRQRMSGENSPNKQLEKRTKHSKLMKDGMAAYVSSCNKNPSKPQVQLFEKIKLLYPSAVLNFVYMKYCIDIAIPELKLAIEYDEPYWHKDREGADRKRQSEIEKDGWKFLRYKKIPSDQEMRRDLGEWRNSDDRD